MAIDYFVHYPCDPKRALGGGDPDDGTGRLLDLLNARDRAAAIRQMAQRDGRNPEDVTITLKKVGPGGRVVDEPLSYRQMVEQAAQLTPLEPACVDCPANGRNRPFGCGGSVRYPIPPASEEWLIELLQPAESVGGRLFQRAVADFKYTGEPMKRFRQAGFLAPDPVKLAMESSSGPPVVVTSDQLWQPILCVGGGLDPGHCFGILLWLGGVRLDGRDLESFEDVKALLQLSVEDRRTRTAPWFGPPTDDRAVESLRGLLTAMYLAWVLDVPALVSA